VPHRYVIIELYADTDHFKLITAYVFLSGQVLEAKLITVVSLEVQGNKAQKSSLPM
jgi:hypothetical protein